MDRKSGADAPLTGGLVEVDPDDLIGTPAKIVQPDKPKPPPISLMDWKAHGHGKCVVTRDNRDEWDAMWRRWSPIDNWERAWQIAYERCQDQPKIWPSAFQVHLDELELQIEE